MILRRLTERWGWYRHARSFGKTRRDAIAYTHERMSRDPEYRA